MSCTRAAWSGYQPWFGFERNTGRSLATIAEELGITIDVATAA